MANNAGTYLQNMLLNWVKGTSFHAIYANTYVALFTTQPANDGTGGTEVSTSGTAYGRVAIADSGWSSLTGATPTSISNSGVVTFATATADWGVVTSFGLYDASTSGDLLFVAPLVATQTILNGSTASFAIGTLILSAD